MKNLKTQFIGGMMVLGLLVGCGEESSSVASVPVLDQQTAQQHQTQTTVQTVVSRRSQSFGAGQIQMSYQLLDQPIIGFESRIQLKFELPPLHNLQINISDNDHIELMHSHEMSYEGTSDGIVEVIVEYKPIEAGKTYLKFIASTADGQKIRAFAIALAVADQTGIVPERKKTTKSRINLPSSN